MGRRGNANCTIEGCDRKELARGWCTTHYHRWRRAGDPLQARPKADPYGAIRCKVDSCESQVQARGWCPAHYQRWRLYGDPLGRAELRRPKTIEELRREAYEGAPGGQDTPSGYRYRTLRRGERYAEHRLVMEHVLGRALYPDETVHHRNGVRSDNRPENLELWSSWQPAGQRVEDKVVWARELLARYEAA